MVGEVYVAVTVVLALIVTLHAEVCAVVHPDHEVKVCDPEVAGAVIVTVVPAL
jgi:hypothetical protein